MAKSERNLLASLAKHISVKIDGRDIRVAVGNEANKVIKCLLVSRARTLAEDQIKKYNERDVVLTPRELKDLIDAVARMAESSGDVYEKLDVELASDQPRNAEKVEEVGDINFDDATKPKNGDTGRQEDSQPAGGREVGAGG